MNDDDRQRYPWQTAATRTVTFHPCEDGFVLMDGGRGASVPLKRTGDGWAMPGDAPTTWAAAIAQALVWVGMPEPPRPTTPPVPQAEHHTCHMGQRPPQADNDMDWKALGWAMVEAETQGDLDAAVERVRVALDAWHAQHATTEGEPT